MDRNTTLKVVETEETPSAVSLRTLRQNLNELRRQARQLDEPALENCLSLAISLTAARRAND